MSENDDFATSADLPDGPAIATADDSTGEPWSFDTDGDGITDLVQWNFADGTWQELVDVDADGKADVLMIDVNGDDSADIQIWDNGDGTYTAAQDSDGDGEFESEQTFTRDELDSALPGISDLLDTHFGPSTETPVDGGGDGTADQDAGVEIDSDQDGVIDLVQWDFSDGTWQQLVDVDGDAKADVLLIDVNGDDAADIQIWDNGDGTYTALQDSDGDGVFESEQSFTRDELDANLPGISDLLDSQFGAAPDGPVDGGTDVPPVDDGDIPPADDGSVLLDTDGDGVADTVAWDFGDGTWQELRDVDGDGDADVLVIDTNGDDAADYAVVDNGDGTYTVLQDSDGDGEWDDEGQSFTRAELDESLPGITDLLDSKIEGPVDAGAEQPTTDDATTDIPVPADANTDLPSTDQPTPDVPADSPAPLPAENPTTSGDWTPLDTDGDGIVDAETWSFADGTWQALIDMDGNGQPDVLAIDTNGDDTEDIQVWNNGDGTYTVLYDADGDGTFELQNTFDQAELDARLPGAAALLDSQYGDVADAELPTQPDDGGGFEDTPVVDDDEVAGSPAEDSQYWFNQAENGFCVPASVAMIVSAYTGEEILSEEQFVELANELGLFNVDMTGTPSMTMNDALTLLEAAGVPADLVVGDMDTLYDALEDGRGVMIFIDSDEVWYGDGEGEHAPDHAVVITGIDREAGVAYLSDPGHPDGNMEVVPLSVLDDAWEDSGYTMVVCDEPAPTAGSNDDVTSETADSTSNLQQATSALVGSQWALLPVVLPADAVTTVTEASTR